MLSALITDITYLSSAVMRSPEVKGTNHEIALLAMVVLWLACRQLVRVFLCASF
jgi:hypothetical protein